MSTMKIDRHSTVANVVLEHSECAEVFQRHRIDFCCRGGLSIEAAATERKVDIDALVEQLTRTVRARRTQPEVDPRKLSTPALIDHIVGKHHAYLRGVLPFVRSHATKVSRVHGDHNPKLHELRASVESLAEALLPHLDEEERVLFPALISRSVPEAQQLASMQEEHLAVASLLERVRAASDEFTLPEWACGSYRTLFAELEALERDVFTHVHLENHVLSPRFIDVASLPA